MLNLIFGAKLLDVYNMKGFHDPACSLLNALLMCHSTLNQVAVFKQTGRRNTHLTISRCGHQMASRWAVPLPNRLAGNRSGIPHTTGQQIRSNRGSEVDTEQTPLPLVSIAPCSVEPVGRKRNTTGILNHHLQQSPVTSSMGGFQY